MCAICVNRMINTHPSCLWTVCVLTLYFIKFGATQNVNSVNTKRHENTKSGIANAFIKRGKEGEILHATRDNKSDSKKRFHTNIDYAVSDTATPTKAEHQGMHGKNAGFDKDKSIKRHLSEISKSNKITLQTRGTNSVAQVPKVPERRFSEEHAHASSQLTRNQSTEKAMPNELKEGENADIDAPDEENSHDTVPATLKPLQGNSVPGTPEDEETGDTKFDDDNDFDDLEKTESVTTTPLPSHAGGGIHEGENKVSPPHTKVEKFDVSSKKIDKEEQKPANVEKVLNTTVNSDNENHVKLSRKLVKMLQSVIKMNSKDTNKPEEDPHLESSEAPKSSSQQATLPFSWPGIPGPPKMYMPPGAQQFPAVWPGGLPYWTKPSKHARKHLSRTKPKDHNEDAFTWLHGVYPKMDLAEMGVALKEELKMLNKKVEAFQMSVKFMPFLKALTAKQCGSNGRQCVCYYFDKYELGAHCFK